MRPGSNPDFAEFPILRDLNYGSEYLRYDGSTYMHELAGRYGIRLTNFLQWNGYTPSEFPPTGKILYLKKPKKSLYHIVEEGEDLYQVALKHVSSVSKIIKKNRIPKELPIIFVGQKLYLKKKRPKDEKIIILRPPDDPKPHEKETKEQTSDSEPVVPDSVFVEESAATTTKEDVQQGNTSSPETQWIEHTVQAGETLWKISTRYGTKVEIIKLTNKLSSNEIKPGQVLRVLAKKNKLIRND